MARSCGRVLNDQYIQIVSRSVYPPQEKNPEGEVHDELGLISFDRGRQQYILREFHVEGYVNQYVLVESDPENGRFVFETEAMENMPEGWRARTTYEFEGEDQFREIFDLARPGEEWANFVTTQFARKDE